eukprot:CAMPEP_0168541502 /NCGR_PEP_ID=MMETSP0413-20121227/853_1 /TAXON_ID=136452 /ORGANISM="Filamoeba nolandi, Strain NC-AS-23-1" /LENGTH=55 /DNA_ID=CAMNT_0008571325 /DNA_START=139 /DNA_END=303 /DNA_ORIENTATION=+
MEGGELEVSAELAMEEYQDFSETPGSQSNITKLPHEGKILCGEAPPIGTQVSEEL